MKREEDYIDNINLDMRTRKDIENFLMEYENGKISRDEYISLLFLSYSHSYGEGFSKGFERRPKSKN